MSDIDTKLNNTEEQPATKNVRLKCQKNIEKNHLLQSLFFYTSIRPFNIQL